MQSREVYLDMKTVGLIVEYNPLHNGHLYHFRQSLHATGAEASIAVMSGHFLQRGEPAIISKWARAEMALRIGVDLVIELPTIYANQPAEWFAYGAVGVLDATGVVDELCFGSESGELGWMQKLAEQLYAEPAPFRRLLKEQLSLGLTFPVAYNQAAQAWLHHLNLTGKELAQPNNTLGLHYLMALHRLQSSIKPATIQRSKAGYNQATVSDEHIASATALRNLWLQQRSLEPLAPFVPSSTYQIMIGELEQGRGPVTWDKLFRQLLLQLTVHSAAETHTILGMEEGLEYRFQSVLRSFERSEHINFDLFLQRLKTKRYTRTRLQRTCVNVLLQLSKQAFDAEIATKGVPYLRVLGFSEKGRRLLKKMKTKAKAPVITKASELQSDAFEFDLRAAGIYALGFDSIGGHDLLADYYRPPIQFNDSEQP